jgi:hypothetical protein
MEAFHGDMDMNMGVNMTEVAAKVCKMNMSVR